MQHSFRVYKLAHTTIALVLIWRTVRRPAVHEREEGQGERSAQTRFDPHDNTAQVTKPVGFRSLPFSFLADTVSRNRTFGHHVGLPLAEGLEMISRYVWQHLLSRFRFIPSNHLCFVTRSHVLPKVVSETFTLLGRTKRRESISTSGLHIRHSRITSWSYCSLFYLLISYPFIL